MNKELFEFRKQQELIAKLTKMYFTSDELLKLYPDTHVVAYIIALVAKEGLPFVTTLDVSDSSIELVLRDSLAEIYLDVKAEYDSWPVGE